MRIALAKNLILTSILLSATIGPVNPGRMWAFWHGFVVSLPALVLRGAHVIWDASTPLW